MIEKDQNYFEKIDTEAKAYFLGLMYADGYNGLHETGGHIALTLQEQDKEILEMFLKELKSNSTLNFLNLSEKNSKQSNCYELRIHSKKICEDLTKLGCMRCKTALLQYPNLDVVPNSLINHFIRGYFDGDGCIWNGKRKEMIVSDPKHKDGFRKRIVHNVKFQITGNLNFIDKLQDKFIELFNFKKNKLNTSKSKFYVTMEYSGRKQIKTIYDYFYTDSSFYIKRKKEKFEEIINFCASLEKSEDETRLIAGKPEMVISSEASTEM